MYGGRDLLTRAEAATILGVTPQAVSRLIARGRLAVSSEKRGRRRFRMEDVLEYADTRLRAHHLQMPPDIQRWGPRNRPVEQGALMTVAEAAAVLRVAPSTVRKLVANGLLPAYQRDPCKPGSRLRIPSFHVYARRDRPEYRKRREAWERQDEAAAKETRPWPERGIPPRPYRGPTRHCERDYGRLYTTRQASMALGVAPNAVLHLARRGRLHAQTRNPELDAYLEAYGVRRQRGRGNRWLFFRKDEVHALLRDPDYQKLRKAFDLGRSPERIAARQAAEAERWERYLREYLEYARRHPIREPIGPLF